MARNVLVSGGTGALGRAVVEAFLDAGDRVVVPWIVESERDALAADLSQPLDAGSLALVAADVAEADGAAAAVAAAEPVAVLVNGAGGFAGGTPHADTPLEAFDRMYRINLRTAAALCQAALPGMTSRGTGCIVNVASRAAIDRPPTLAAYSASKAGVLVLTETLQKEVADRGVRVNAVVPTTIDTPANRAAMPDADFGSWTPPAAIAAVVRWLASDAAASVRGGAIPV
ncbi:MAG: SDR family NAD(P)-dependent oxidoreductase [Deltaproteobacteria bacterium]|jgi:NAD(P)-dependent dehydrogenase (short-subunit alcohol dehydrogenase family)|nr:SDR family NAD(P)-dependent oxidoreductase [Deltaproteobacteria bacterium]MBW2370911.1 SDR family NAD(P)-dependent oxidoreductase [Deltaproteobacteria bacterium]